MTSWNDSIHFCRWQGVTCGRRHQRVTKLDLQSSKLVGSISPHIGNLSFLRNLSLFNNSFHYEIPPQIGCLHKLQCIYLGHNTLIGKFQAIYLVLGTLSKLQSFFISRNNMIGGIPPSFANLSSLYAFVTSDNNFHGITPTFFGQLTKLEYFCMAANGLFGTIPLSIFNLSSLIVFDVADNQIQGYLPSEVGITLQNVREFTIANNQFTGSIPVSISNASNLEVLQLNGNNLSGKDQSLEKLNRISRFSITFNNLGNGRENDLNFLCSLTNATYLTFLGINASNFGGEVPKCIGNLSTTLTRLYLDNNKLSGKISTEIGNLINLERLDTWNNKLSGNIPSEIGKLQKLQFLALSDNNLYGYIPSSLGNLTILTKLYLHQNNLEGNIPLSLCKCQNLFTLNLANNNLIDLSANQFTGALPLEIGKFKNLEQMDISENMLFGKIPASLGSCVKLEIIAMRRNLFQGIVPPSLESLRGLEFLDLSNNNLSGQIPNFLEHFVFLQFLNLSYNHFEGEVPMEGVFKNMSATTIKGNEKLCGGIPKFQLPKCKYEKSKRRKLTLTLKLKIFISFGLLGVTLILSLLLLYSLRNKRKENTSSDSRDLFPNISYQSILNATNKFSPTNLIGLGSFGSVYKGILGQGKHIVAIKVLNLLRHGATKSFVAECKALRNIRHRNLVKVLTSCSGIDYQGNDFKALVYEFMANGNLDEWLHPTSRINEMLEEPRSLSLLQRLNISIDVANALDYLHHHCQTPVIHCDLKPSNVLLDDEMIGHVGDFGLARLLFDASQDSPINHSSSVGVRGTIGYTPPEYGMGNEVSTYGDVYSFGILLLEIFTGKRPTNKIFQERLNLHDFVKASLPERILDIVDPILLQKREVGETRMNDITGNEGPNGIPKSQECLILILGIGVACSVEFSRERMNMSAVITELNSIRRKLLGTHIRKQRLQVTDKITHDPLGVMASWNNSIHFCHWRGVTCDCRHQRVTTINLPSLKLVASISPYVGNLSFLRNLTLQNNSFLFEIPPEIGRLRKLQYLGLHDNTVNGKIPSNLSGSIPPSSGNLSFLEEFSLTSNNLGVTIPHSFSKLTKLFYFNVQTNRLSGTISPSIFNLSSIIEFNMGSNQIQGHLPSNIGITLPNIYFFSIFQNQFIGSIPVSISNASNLGFLDLNANKLSGKIPSLEKLKCTNALFIEIPTEIGNLINLKRLDIWKNKLSGNVPSEIGKLKKLQYLSLSQNNFSGNIPISLGNLTSLTRLYLYKNNLQGNIPLTPQVIGLSLSPVFLNLSANQFIGVLPMEPSNHHDTDRIPKPQPTTVPNPTTNATMRHRSTTSPPPHTRRSQHHNLPDAHIPHRQSHSGEEFRELRGKELDISENMLSRKIPKSLGSYIKLEYLFMGRNLFQGNIPPSLESLRGLQYLDLSENDFSGQIPKILEAFFYLKFLNLSYNHFRGEVPTDGVFKNISATSVEGNSKLCGGIPKILGVTLVLSLLFLYSLRKKRKENTLRDFSKKFLLKLSYQSLLNATNGFSSTNLIGVGNFGFVYKGSLDHGGQVNTVAIKVLNPYYHGASESFIVECEALPNIRHRNLVKVLTSCFGIDYQGHDFNALVYEFMRSGNLDEWLHPTSRSNETLEEPRSLSFHQRLNIAIDIANALDYLHQNCHTKIVHCDLKPSNILLDDEMIGHVSDFGLAKLLFDATEDSSINHSSSIILWYIIARDVYGKRPTDNIFQNSFNLHDFVKATLPERIIDIVDPILLQKGEVGEKKMNDLTHNESQNGSPKSQECLILILEIGVACSMEFSREMMNMSGVVIELNSIR
ncbi:hypothetical protein ACJW31_11G147600 [Castanea mollissima]